MSKTICSLPWTHLATHPHGGCTLCCVSDHRNGASRARDTESDGHTVWLTLNRHSIDRVMNSEYYKQVRLEMLAGKEPAACTRCYDDERAGLRSKRAEENARYLDKIQDQIAKTEADGTIPVSFRFIELRLGNVCNLICRTCNPASSSKWVKEHADLEKKYNWITQYGKVERGEWFELDTFWEELLEKSGDLERIYINGGEPTLVEKHFVYLERLIERGLNQQVELWYNINLSQLPPKLLALWQQFKTVTVSCSIDDLRERNDYIRRGSDWTTVTDNLMQLKNLPWVNLSIVQTISSYSVLYLDEFYNYFVNELGIHVHLNWCYDPEFLAPWNLPHSVKQTAIERCRQVMKPWDFKNVEEHLNKVGDPNNLEKFKVYTAELDRNRGESFAETFPELAEALQ